MKVFYVLESEKCEPTYENRFFNIERAKSALASSTKWAEQEKNGKTFSVVERDEDIEMYYGIAIPNKVFLKHNNGIKTEVDVDRVVGRLSTGHRYEHIVGIDDDSFKMYNELNEFRCDYRHMVHDIYLAGFRQLDCGMWQAEYNLVGGVDNGRTAHGDLCDFNTPYDKNLRSIDSVSGYHQVSHNLSIYW